MLNPWLKLPSHAPYILEMDQHWADKYQTALLKTARKTAIPAGQAELLHQHTLRFDIIPFPYYGNPLQATVFVLQANPGYDPQWQTWSRGVDILNLDGKNLLHQNEVPLYYTQPDLAYFHDTTGKLRTDWYWSRTRRLRELVGWKTIAYNLVFLEMFPYRSIKLRYPTTLPPSQAYTCQLLRDGIKRGSLIIIGRMKRQWQDQVPELLSYANCISVHSAQSAYLSPGNLGEEGFGRVVMKLKQTSLL